jgi:hypothetical protein
MTFHLMFEVARNILSESKAFVCFSAFLLNGRKIDNVKFHSCRLHLVAFKFHKPYN